MPVSAFMPDAVVEIAFDSAPDDPDPTWTDVSEYVEARSNISITRGRSDELSEIQPSRLTVTFDNTDGRFTPGNTSSPYSPNVKKNRKIRVSATPITQTPNPSFEADLTGWQAKGAGNSVEHVTTDAKHGSACVRLTGTGTANRVMDHGEDTAFLTAASAGEVWSAAAWGKWETGATPRSLRVDVRFLDAGLSYIEPANLGTSVATNTSTWVQAVSLAAVAPANTAWVTVRILYLSPAAGDAGLVDDVQLEQGSTLDTTRRRFTGYIDEWPVVWPSGTDEYASVTISASSRRARLSAGAELRSIIETECLADSPTAYYPMGEPPPKGGGQAGDISVNRQPNLVATGDGAGITWQGATGPGTDSLSAPLFNGGRYLLLAHADPALVDSANDSWTVEAFINTTDDSGVTSAAVAVFNALNGYTWFGITTDGTPQAVVRGTEFSVDRVLSSATEVNDGETHHLLVRQTVVGTTLEMAFYVDGVQVDSDDLVGLSTQPEHRRMSVGEFAPTWGVVPGGWDGSISHVAVTSSATEMTDARIAAHADAGLTGFSGESSDARIERLADYAGIPAGEVSTEVGQSTSIANQDTTDQTPLTLMEQVVDTEAGLLFDAPDGTLTFHSRAHRYNAASAFTLDAGLQEIGASIEAKLDGQQLVNDITASRSGGDSTVRVLDEDSITEHGVARDQIELFTTSDNEMLDAANWRLHRYAEPDVRITAVSVDLINQSAALIDDLLDAELGDKITLDNLPDQAPSTSVDMFVDGITETIGAESYTIAFELTPAAGLDVWVLDSATHSQLGTSTVLAY